MTRAGRLRALASAALAVAACGGEPTPTPVRQPTQATCPPGDPTTYESFGRGFAERYCTLCHSSTVSGPARRDAPVGLDFDSVAGVRAAAAEIDRVAGSGPAAINRDMPPGSPRPTDEERVTLARWLACGAP